MDTVVTQVAVLDGDGPTMLIAIDTSAGSIQIIGECGPFDRDLVITRAHIQGLFPGALGRRGLNVIAQKIMEYADVDTLEIHGGIRTTGRNIGRPPKPFFARRRVDH